VETVVALLGTILIDGITYGMILFLVTIGLAVTLGLMRVVNLAHGLFAMLGGYVAVYLSRQFGTSFEMALLLSVATIAVISLPVELLLIRSVYKRSQLDQALLTIGVMFVGIALANLAFGSTLKSLPLPNYLSGAIDIGFRYVPAQRLFVVAVGIIVPIALWLLLERTKFGNNVRATVDNVGMAAAVGVNTKLVYAVAFAIGAGLAALGGILGAEILPMEPTYPIKYLVVFLAVVAVGGMQSLFGTFFSAMLLGISETASKYLLPDLSSIVFFAIVLVVLSWRPQGLFGRAPA
jgi:branched-chain amino acid transport system permease protein